MYYMVKSGFRAFCIRWTVCQKRDNPKFVGGFAPVWASWVSESQHSSLEALSLWLWVISVDPALITWHFFQV